MPYVGETKNPRRLHVAHERSAMPPKTKGVRKVSPARARRLMKVAREMQITVCECDPQMFTLEVE